MSPGQRRGLPGGAAGAGLLGQGWLCFFFLFLSSDNSLLSPRCCPPAPAAEALPPPAQDAPELSARRWVPLPGLGGWRRGPRSPSGSAGLRAPPPLPGSARGPCPAAAPPRAPIATAGGGGHLGGGAMSGSKARAAAAAGPEKKPPPGSGGALSRLRGRRGSADAAPRPPWTESDLLALETVRPEHVLGLCRVTESECGPGSGPGAGSARLGSGWPRRPGRLRSSPRGRGRGRGAGPGRGRWGWSGPGRRCPRCAVPGSGRAASARSGSSAVQLCPQLRHNFQKSLGVLGWGLVFFGFPLGC